ncbi:MAG: 6-phosphogluconolactonase [Proteobacteria bacterium]|nr:6-phosphogluconolactonase [Pseudomonadota bacterium]MBU1714087.1 6-phosphogluconolactonase [Pseudomonadota bacterium]
MINSTHKTEIREYATPEEQIRDNSDLILQTALKEIKEKGFFTLVLTGGQSPQKLYESLASSVYADRMPWQQTYIFWGDERCVKPNHPDSNFGMAQEKLLSKIKIPTKNIFRMAGEVRPREEAAKSYQKKIKLFFSEKKHRGISPDKIPVFDLMLLGIGKDGHIASLFPYTKSLNVKDCWVITVPPGTIAPLIPRLTLTLPIINNTNSILFMISDNLKLPMVRQIINNRNKYITRYPAALIQPRQRLFWSLG